MLYRCRCQANFVLNLSGVHFHMETVLENGAAISQNFVKIIVTETIIFRVDR